MLNLSHKNLKVYQIGLKLVQEIYQITKQFPKEEQYVIISQLRRAAISVCSNIAEGAARRSKPEKIRFYEMSRSSAVEIDTQFEIALTLGFVQLQQTEQIKDHLESVFRILSKMIENLNK
jgi:four helix bundle protein